MQKDIWEKEYRENKHLPSSRTTRPSKAVSWFVENYIETKKIRPQKALDIGSGLGRNSIYLAKLGLAVDGIDIVRDAVKKANEEAVKAKVGDFVLFYEQSAGEVLPFENASFDLIVDMMTMHTLDPEERAIYAENVVRLLRPDGHFLFYTIDAESPDAQELFNTSPGPEPNSYVVPQVGAIEKAFSQAELIQLFSPLEAVELVVRKESVPAFEGVYDRQFLLGLMRKNI